MDLQHIKLQQMDFYLKHHSGCSFAAVAAKDASKYGWKQVISSPDHKEISLHLEEAIASDETTTLSLIFPDIKTGEQLVELIQEFKKVDLIIIEENPHNNYICYGVRVKVYNFVSWVSGFGNFDFLPKTRQTPYTEIAVRVKPRPEYEWVLKESEKGVIHLADLDMKGLSKCIFKRLWDSSLKQTKRILGHKPDLLSAAKTTFGIPKSIIL